MEGYSHVLYTDGSPDSREAESVLDGIGIQCQKFFIDNPAREQRVVPELLAPQGTFPGINNIRWYARVYGNVK